MIIAADVHYGLTSDSVDVGGVPSKMVWTMKRLYELSTAAWGQRDRTLILAGDIFDSTSPSPLVLSTFTDWLWAANKENVHIIIIPGNHDRGFDWSATDVVRSPFHGNVHVVDKLDLVPVGGSVGLFLPHKHEWRTEGSITDEVRARAKLTRTDFVIAHGQLSMIYEHGSEDVLEAGNAMVFNPVELAHLAPHVFIGHVHHHQDLSVGKRQNIIHLPGSLITNDFAEVGASPGYYEYNKGKPPVYHKFKRSEWTYANLDLDVRSLAEPVEKYIEKRLKGNMLRVRFRVPENYAWDRVRILSVIEALGAHVCRTETHVIRPKKQSTAAVPAGIVHFGLDHAALLRGHIQHLNLTPKQKTAAYHAGMEVIEACLKK